MNRISQSLRTSITLTCLAMAVSTGYGEKADVDGEALLRKMGAVLSEATSSRVMMSQELLIKAEGMKQEMTTAYRVSLRKPSHFAMEITSGVMGASLITDGEHVHFYWPMMQRYTESEAPGDVEAVFDMPEYAMGAMSMGQINLARAIVSEDPAAVLLEGASGVEYVGIEDLDGVESHHLKIVQGVAPMVIEHDLWLYTGDRPLPIKVSTDMSKSMAAAERATMPGMKDMEMKTQTVLERWELGVETRDSEFVFRPPEGAEKMDSPFGAGEESGGGDANGLVGLDAPDFTLMNMEGEEVTLSSHEGESVVVLDFWATWCGPCVRAMPELQEVAEKYGEKGVTVYAVNQQEGKSKVESFLKKRKIQLDVLLDTEGAAGTAYRANAIPQTVIIDKAGKIQAVHVGYTPRLESILSAELDALLKERE